MIRKKKPWKTFVLQAAIVGAAVWGGMTVAMERYKIGIDAQSSTSIPGKRVFIIDLRNTDFVRGDLVAFYTHGFDPYFPDGTRFVKRVVGLPGDHVIVGDPLITVEGKPTGWGVLLADHMGVPQEHFRRDLVVPEGHIWVMGGSHDSFDSRYWGVLPVDRLIGRVYAVY